MDGFHGGGAYFGMLISLLVSFSRPEKGGGAMAKGIRMREGRVGYDFFFLYKRIGRK